VPVTIEWTAGGGSYFGAIVTIHGRAVL